jgi:hypothetical protein
MDVDIKGNPQIGLKLTKKTKDQFRFYSPDNYENDRNEKWKQDRIIWCIKDGKRALSEI